MCPAGSPEAVRAAVRAGADAVYFGAGDFNARRNAKNFSDEELAEALKYCRLRGVHTYLTVNTLVTDRELPAAKELILRLNELGADAVIVQDLGMARMIRAVAPELPLHASTQMSVHNLGGVLAAQKLGFSRVVLARELPREEIAFLCKNSPIELEVFVHGALCMCHSGQCYLSSAIGGRSGNRGLCAQPCRMAYSFFGDSPSYPLSLKDLCLAPYLGELESMGVSAVKIEGRMKRPEYVALTASIYKRALTEHRAPTREELRQLETAFSRDGFTDGYYRGQREQTKGDGMFGVRGEGEGREVRALYKEVQRLYESEPEPPTVPVDMTFTARADKPLRLVCTDDRGNGYEATALAAEKALTRATTEDEARAFLCKTGGTIFAPRAVRIELDAGLRLPASTVNAMRRQCLDGLTARRRQPPRRPAGEWQPGVRRLPYAGAPGRIFSFLSFAQVTPEILAHRPDYVYLPLAEIAADLPRARALAAQTRLAAVLDRVIFDREWPAVLEQLRALRAAGLDELVCTNLGQIALLEKLGFTLHGDFGLNVMNSQSIKELRQMGLSSCTLSFEMNLAQIRDLSMGMDCQILAYGRLPLMITESCVFRRKNETCTCTGKGVAIIDKTGRAFPLHREQGCRTTVYNAEKLYLADKLPELERLGLRWLRLCFTTENSRECEAVIRAYEGGPAAAPERLTRGLYYRGVQ